MFNMTRYRKQRKRFLKGGNITKKYIRSKSSEHRGSEHRGSEHRGSEHRNSQIKRKSKTFKKLKCSPRLKSNKKDYTCYTSDSLKKIRNLWNKKHPDVRIEADAPREIWGQLRNNMGNVCNKESCWLNQQFMRNNLDKELLNYTFAPKSPASWKKDPNTWLNSLDIERVMKQYEHTYPCFEFLGPSPIDFDDNDKDGYCVWPEIKDLNIKKEITNGKNKIGIIFNLDPHYKGGSHWVSAFINIKKGELNYFDSNGENIPRRVKKLMNRLIEQGKELGIKFELNINKREHQREDTECGIYSLYFVTRRIEDKPFKYFTDNRISDEEMMRFRKRFFNGYDNL